MRLRTSGRNDQVEALLGAALIVLGGMTTLGWLLHVPIMVMIVDGLLPMVLTTGLCFLAAGIALTLTRTELRPVRWARQGIGAAMVVLCSLILIEHLLDLRLGVDFAPLHAWYEYGNTRPGRMAPNTATGFILAGAAIYLSSHVRRRGHAVAVILLTFLLLAVGLTGLVGYLLNPELLFNWARSARMAAHTAVGMIGCAIGLWASWSRSSWYLSEQYFQEAGKIRLLSAAIFIISTITIGLSGFALLQGSLEQAAQTRLEAIINGRGPWFNAMVNDAHRNAAVALDLSGLRQRGIALLDKPRQGAQLAPVAAGSAVLVQSGYRGLVLNNADGVVVHAAGTFKAAPELSAPLNADGSMTLVWDQDFLLRSRLPLVRDGKLLGQIVIDHPLPALQAALFNTGKLGGSAEIAVCVDRGRQLMCFPNTKNARPFAVARRAPPAQPLPMELALDGEHGVAHGIDYQGNNVLAAHGQLAPKLGFVAKQSTAEAYAGIRRSLQVGAPVIFGVSLLGAIILISQLSPLVSKMRASEQAAADAAAEMESIMAAAGDGIVIIDDAGRITSINIAACRIFGYWSGDVVGQDAVMLMPSAVRGGRREDDSLFATGGMAHLLGAPNSLVQGLRKGGEQFPLEVSINMVTLATRTLFVAIVRDITVRKEMEDRLSHLAQFDTLTGLPNRALFMDRLGTALARARRTQGALALMFLDLDGFKAVNDNFGHEGGDVLLQQVSERLLSQVRSSDTVARLAGDEFTVILENFSQPLEDAVMVAQKIVDAMQASFRIQGREARVTVSIGLIIHDTDQEELSLAELMRRADDEMYAVKRDGKNAFKVARSMEPGTAERRPSTSHYVDGDIPA
jgi:diguanylate cyclase (GGDEF)-like protein/PAS domain S-box-containing protein